MIVERSTADTKIIVLSIHFLESSYVSRSRQSVSKDTIFFGGRAFLSAPLCARTTDAQVPAFVGPFLSLSGWHWNRMTAPCLLQYISSSPMLTLFLYICSVVLPSTSLLHPSTSHLFTCPPTSSPLIVFRCERGLWRNSSYSIHYRKIINYHFENKNNNCSQFLSSKLKKKIPTVSRI